MFVGQKYFEEMARTYSASRVIFNRSILNDINMRVFEALCSGSLLVTNDLANNGQSELFHDGEHLVTYRDPEELLEKTAYYLGHEDVREVIAARGRKEVLARHTYRHRMEQLLASIGSRPLKTAIPEAGVSAASHPWVAAPDEVAAELMAELPRQPGRVLVIERESRQLSQWIESQGVPEVIGVTHNPKAAEAPQDVPDGGWIGDIERTKPSFPAHGFGAVVCHRVVEHMEDPIGLLRRVGEWLAPGGSILVTVANARHHQYLKALLEGNCPHQGGLPRQNQLRLFTRRGVEKLLYRAGFCLSALRPIFGAGSEEWQRQGCPGQVNLGRLRLGPLTEAEAADFYTSDYVVRAVPADLPSHALTSIVILTYNQLAFTRMCVDSILQYTDEPYELIFVDNASSDGTLDYLRSVPHAHVIANATNRGFPAGANQGMRVARGRQVLLLNNDTVVTTGWLRRLLRALHADPAIGLAGPCSNCVSGEQQIPVPYDDVPGIDGFAWDWGLAHDSKVQETDRLVGFCLLIRKEVIDRVGFLDEQFGIGCFEDDDYCLRVLRAGFRAVIAQDSFVHHFGGRTFVGSAVDYAGLMERNQAMFLNKWSKEADSAPAPSPTPPESDSRKPVSLAIQEAPGGGLLLVGRVVHVSLCMIVRDNARTIGPCLESIRPWVDEMIVVDTGSKDETPRIAQRMGARVFHFLWCDDFSAARNESLRHARGQWIFWMDSDDTIDADCGRKMRELAYDKVDSRTMGYIMQVHCPGPGESGHNDLTVVDHVKLFRNLPQLRFDGRIHEQILPAIRALGGEVAWTPLFVVHSGYDHSPEGQERKKQRDLRILQLELSERPTHPFTLFNLGMTYADIGEYHQAVDYLERSLRNSSPEESHLRKVYSLLVYCHMQIQDGAAWRRCEEGLRLFPKDLELRFRLGVLQHSSGQLEAAAATYRQLLGEKADRYFTSMDRGIQGFKARQNLAVVFTDLGDFLRAEEQWRLVVAEAPQYELGWQGLVDILLRQNKTNDALAVADELAAHESFRSQGFLLRSQALLRQDEEGARHWLRKGIQNGLHSLEPLRALCQFFFEQGSANAAEEPLRELLQRLPEDAAAYHNLGTVYMNLGRHQDAVTAYQASVRFRPNSAPTRLLLSEAFRKLGRLAESRLALQHVLQIEPHNPEAIEALRQLGDNSTRSTLGPDQPTVRNS
jgi:GT2 family glycosyltransferase/cytochrome c-type biogenesis protein CcmH/NrfG